MKLTCPACGAQTSLEAMTEDAAARRVAALFGELPPVVARQVPAYLALFRPAKTGLRWTRVETILGELVPMVHDGFKRGGRVCKAAADHWATALHQVCGRELRLPLKGHGYLLEVVAGLADHQAAAAEVAHHENLRAGKRPARREDAPARDRTAEAIEAVMHRWQSGFISEQQKDSEIQEIKGIGGG